MAIHLTFCGAARTVTGSRYLIESDRARVLVDCGMFQERHFLRYNWEDYHIDPAAIDAVVLTHGHMDHCGWLPKLVQEGFRGPVFATSATTDLVPIILRDIARIQVEDARTKAKRHAKERRTDTRPPRPLYDGDDAEETIGRLQPVARLGTPVAVAPGVTATWGENGHILGASWLALDVEGKRLVFSGDVGRWDRPILHDPAPPFRADCLILESTYGDRSHIPSNTEEQLEEVARIAAERGGNLLIPSFSVERAQELLYALSSLGRSNKLPQNAVYLDSPMAAKVTDLFRRHPEVCDEEMLALMQSGKSPFAFAGLEYVTAAEESKRLNRVRSGVIIIAGNGMCTGGRIKHHLQHNLDNPGTILLFAGYQAPGTLGRQLLDGAEEIRLFNRPLPVKLEVRQLYGLSSHADRSELFRWTDTLAEPPGHCYVTHGSEEASAALASALRDEKGWRASNPSHVGNGDGVTIGKTMRTAWTSSIVLAVALTAGSGLCALEIPDHMAGTWLIEAVSDVSLRSFGLQITADPAADSGRCSIQFLRTGKNYEAKALTERDSTIELAWDYETRRRGRRTMRLSGPMAGDAWLGEFVIIDPDGTEGGSGTFSGRRLDPKELEHTSDNFAGVWVGHYGDHGERFRIRFELSDGPGILTGAAVMPDEGIRASISQVRIDEEKVILSAGWEVPALDIKARVEFDGSWRGDRWGGRYSVYPDGGRQAMAGGRFSARRPPGHAAGRTGAKIIGSVEPPPPNGLLTGIWEGLYRSREKDFGIRLEISVVNDRYHGTIFLPDDRMEAAIAFASDVDARGVVMGSVEIMDADGEPETLTIRVDGALQDDEWHGDFDVGSNSSRWKGPFRMKRR